MKLYYTIHKTEDKSYKNFYLELDNGRLIPIQVKAFKTSEGKILNYKDIYALDVVATKYEG